MNADQLKRAAQLLREFSVSLLSARNLRFDAKTMDIKYRVESDEAWELAVALDELANKGNDMLTTFGGQHKDPKFCDLRAVAVRRSPLYALTNQDLSAENNQCSGTILDNFEIFPCPITAHINRNGKWYCGIHDPIARAEKAAARHVNWMDEARAAGKAGAEQKRRADLYDELVEALESTHSALHNVLGRRAVHDADEILLRSSSVLAKCKGEKA